MLHINFTSSSQQEIHDAIQIFNRLLNTDYSWHTTPPDLPSQPQTFATLSTDHDKSILAAIHQYTTTSPLLKIHNRQATPAPSHYSSTSSEPSNPNSQPSVPTSPPMTTAIVPSSLEVDSPSTYNSPRRRTLPVNTSTSRSIRPLSAPAVICSCLPSLHYLYDDDVCEDEHNEDDDTSSHLYYDEGYEEHFEEEIDEEADDPIIEDAHIPLPSNTAPSEIHCGGSLS